jgi:tetratricopeptide (TPR) repeat protein
MGRKRTVRPHQDEHREELMRPSRFLGYDRDSLGMYALSKEMWEVAESQFRRAVYLNPYEPAFKQHLAWCLNKQGCCHEAKEWIEKALEQRPDDKDSAFILGKIAERIQAMPPEDPHEGA